MCTIRPRVLTRIQPRPDGELIPLMLLPFVFPVNATAGFQTRKPPWLGPRSLLRRAGRAIHLSRIAAMQHAIDLKRRRRARRAVQEPSQPAGSAIINSSEGRRGTSGAIWISEGICQSSVSRRSVLRHVLQRPTEIPALHCRATPRSSSRHIPAASERLLRQTLMVRLIHKEVQPSRIPRLSERRKAIPCSHSDCSSCSCSEAKC
jgi:hypothetical protein